jgi:hypothetical protein
LISTAIILIFVGDAPPDSRFGFQLFPEAQALFGVWRRAARRTAVIGGAAVVTAAAVAGSAEAAAANQQAAPAPAPAPASEAKAAPASGSEPKAAPASGSEPKAAPVPASADSGQPLPLGTVVNSLPGSCTDTPVGGITYYYCSGNFYRAVFQGNTLVYVTAKP